MYDWARGISLLERYRENGSDAGSGIELIMRFRRCRKTNMPAGDVDCCQT